MDIGMLWYDDDPKRPLDEKVQRAADYYQRKYGQPATECYVNPDQLDATAPERVGLVRLRRLGTVIKNHFWLGRGNDAAPQG